MTVANKVHKQGLQHHALCHITIHPYISSCKPKLRKLSLTAATYVGMHGYVASLLVFIIIDTSQPLSYANCRLNSQKVCPPPL